MIISTFSPAILYTLNGRRNNGSVKPIFGRTFTNCPGCVLRAIKLFSNASTTKPGEISLREITFDFSMRERVVFSVISFSAAVADSPADSELSDYYFSACLEMSSHSARQAEIEMLQHSL